jgi:O-antigen/teichoic acid export membrane protein
VTLGDQVLSSVSNVLAVILVARAVSAEDFGTFALGYSVMTFVLALTRSYFGIRVSLNTDRVHARAHSRDLVGAIAILAPAMMVVVFVVSRLAAGSGAAVGVLLIVAIATPVVCMQDVLRFGAVASGHPKAAVWSDGIWVVLMLVPFALGTRLDPAQVMTLWLFAALAALAVALLSLRILPDLRGGWRELKTRHAVGEATTWSSVIGSLGALWILFVASAAISPVASGSLRGAATTMPNVLLAYVGSA